MAQSLFRDDIPAEVDDATGWLASYNGHFPAPEQMAEDAHIKCSVTIRPAVVAALARDPDFLATFVARQAMAKRVCPTCFGIGGNGTPCQACHGTGFEPLPPAEPRDTTRLAMWEHINATGQVVDHRDATHLARAISYESNRDFPLHLADDLVIIDDAELAYGMVYAAEKHHDEPPAWWLMWCWENLIAWRHDRPETMKNRDTFGECFGLTRAQCILVGELAAGRQRGCSSREFEHLKPLGFPSSLMNAIE